MKAVTRLRPATARKAHASPHAVVDRPAAKNPDRPLKRSFRIAGHPTSISLEAPFWDALVAAAARQGISLTRLVADIDAARGATNLSSAVRVWILRDLQGRAPTSPAGSRG